MHISETKILALTGWLGVCPTAIKRRRVLVAVLENKMIYQNIGKSISLLAKNKTLIFQANFIKMMKIVFFLSWNKIQQVIQADCSYSRETFKIS